MTSDVIIGYHGKIQATVDNARAMMSATPTLEALAKSYEITRTRAPRSLADLPSSTPQAEAFAKQLKSQGYRFVGPTSMYAFMQNAGVVNDHVHGCFRASDYRTSTRSHGGNAVHVYPRYWATIRVKSHAAWGTPLQFSPGGMPAPHDRSRLADQNVSRPRW